MDYFEKLPRPPELEDSNFLIKPTEPPRSESASGGGPHDPLRILFVVLNFAPEPTGTGKYTGELADHLSRMGHEVRVVTSHPYYPQWKRQPGLRSLFYGCESRGSMEILRCPIYVPDRPSKIRRILHLASAGLSFLPGVVWAWRFRPDLIITIQPSMATSIAAYLASVVSRAPLWMHVQDLEIAAGKTLRMLPPALLNLSTAIEKWVYQHCHGLSTISSSMSKALDDRGAVREPRVFPNWVDTDRIIPQKESRYRSELGLEPGQVVALYSGNLGEKQGLEIIIDAARRLRTDSHLVFVVAGEGSAKERLQELAEGLGNIRFLPLQPAERMTEFLALGDIHLVPQKAGVGALVMPSKMTAILAAGRPVVVTASPDDELAEIADQCGFSVLPGDLSGFINSIRQLADDPVLRAELGIQARQYAEAKLSAEAILGNMTHFAEGLCHPIGAVSSENLT